MALTWENIGDEIIQEYGYLDSDTDLVAKVFNWEKDAVRTIVNHHPWWWLRETVASVNTVDGQNADNLGVGVGKIIKIYHSSGNSEICEADPRVLIERGYDLTTEGKPEYYWPIEWTAGTSTAAGQVKVQWYPVPDAIYAVKVLYLPFELGVLVDGATITNVIPVPGNFYPCVKQFVRHKFSYIDGDIEASQMHYQLFQQHLAEQVLENYRFNKRRRRLQVTDVEDDFAWGPRLDPNHFS